MSEISENISEVKELVGEHEGEVSKITDRLDSIKQDIVSENSEHLAKLTELENRLENLEMDYRSETLHDEALANRIDELENKVEALETVETLENRMKELEKEMKTVSRTEEGQVEKIVEDKLHPNTQRIEKLESQMNEADSAFEDLFEQILQLSEIVKDGVKEEDSFEYGM